MKRTLLTLLCLCTVGAALAQTPSFEEYRFLPRNQEWSIQTLFEDATGYLWVGTNRGLFSFDGYRHRHYTLADSLPHLSVTAIAQDSLGRLWAGCENGGMAYLENGRFHPWQPREGNSNLPISEILWDAHGYLWFGTQGDGLYLWDHPQERLYRFDDIEGLPDLYIYDLLALNDSTLWAGTDGGIAQLKVNHAQTDPSERLSISSTANEYIIKAFAQPSPGTVWAGTEDFGPNPFSPQLAPQEAGQELANSWRYGSIGAMVPFGDHLAIGTQRRGLVFAHPATGSMQHYVATEKLPLRRIQCLLADRSGNLWVGTRSSLLRCPGTQVLLQESLPPLLTSNVQALASDAPNNTLYFANAEGVFAYTLEGRRKGRLTPVLSPDDLGMYPVLTLAVTPGMPYLWVGTYGNGLFQVNTTTGALKNFDEEALGNSNILGIHPIANQQLWLATLGGGVKLGYDPTTGATTSIEKVSAANGLGTDYIYQIITDKQGGEWFATDGQGIVHRSKGQFTQYLLDSTSSQVVYSLAQDGQGTLWASAQNEGLYRFNGQGFEQVGLNQGLRDLNVQALTTNSAGQLVAFHDLGFDVYDPSTQQWSHFGEEVGLSGKIPNLNAASVDALGNAYFGTEQGFVVHQSQKGTHRATPTPVIGEVRLFGSPLPAIPHGQSFGPLKNNFTIDMLGLWYSNPRAITYRYQLENYDVDWIASSNRTVTYSSLPPGTYTFRMQASANGRFQGLEEASFSFTINPPFWQTTWFISSSLLFVILGTWLFVRGRERRLKAAKRLLEQKVEERTQEIQEQNKALGQQKAKIEKQNENITSSINYAKRIQNAILPLDEEIQQHLPGHFVLFKPRDIVSGDFYWFQPYSTKIYFAAVDCTGHGVPGAFMSMIGYSLLNEIVSRTPDISPAEVLTRLNQGVVDALKQEADMDVRRRSNDGMDVSLCRYCTETRQLLFAGAKRPLLVIQNGELTEIKGDKSSIGGNAHIKPGDTVFTNKEVSIDDGNTMVYLFSDGFPDQFGGPQNRKFMTRQLKNLILENHHLDPEAQKHLFSEKLAQWKQEAHAQQTDDILLIGVRF